MSNEFVTGIRDQLLMLSSTMSGWLAIAFVLLAVACLAIQVHKRLFRLIRQARIAQGHFVSEMLERLHGISRLAFVVFVLSIAVQTLPIDPHLADTLGQLLAPALILLIGWAIVLAIDLAALIHLRSYRIDVEDNLLARKRVTQIRILTRSAETFTALATLAAALMTFDAMRDYGLSLLASAGVVGLAVGIAARPVIANILAGVQIALTQPIRIDDVVVVEGQWGWIEQITGTYVVIKLWDWRRLIVPLSYFIEKPFENWTRESAGIIGSVTLHVDYRVRVSDLRTALERIVEATPLWDGRVASLQVISCNDRTIELQVLVSASSSPRCWDLRCEVRERLLAVLQERHPEAMPRMRVTGHLNASESA